MRPPILRWNLYQPDRFCQIQLPGYGKAHRRFDAESRVKTIDDPPRSHHDRQLRLGGSRSGNLVAVPSSRARDRFSIQYGCRACVLTCLPGIGRCSVQFMPHLASSRARIPLLARRWLLRRPRGAHGDVARRRAAGRRPERRAHEGDGGARELRPTISIPVWLLECPAKFEGFRIGKNKMELMGAFSCFRWPVKTNHRIRRISATAHKTRQHDRGVHPTGVCFGVCAIHKNEKKKPELPSLLLRGPRVHAGVYPRSGPRVFLSNKKMY